MRNYLGIPMRLWHFSLLMSALTLITYNIPFYLFVSSHSELPLVRRIVFIASLAAIMLALNFLVCYLVTFLLRYVGRVLIAVTHILNATCLYFVVVYNTLMDGSMMGNVFNTRYSEASGYFTVPLFATIIILGIVPAVYVLWQKIDYGHWKQLGISAASALGTSLALVLLNFNQFLWIGQYDTELGGLLMPWSYIVNSCRILSQQHEANAQEILLPDATFADADSTAVVLVIGESARSANFALYGYGKNTTPRLSAMPDVTALPARSCATYTTAGVKSILEYADQSALYEILPNYLFRTGADVAWRTSNWGEPPVHINEYVTRQELEQQYPDCEPHYDGVLFAGIKQRIVGSGNNKVLIVLHTSTSHGPRYDTQYPPRFELFTPVCKSVEEGKENIAGLVNAYDNTIIYTDHLLADLIDTLRTITNRHTAMLFVSDHGESLGENGLFMHGVPMSIAPREQYMIPFIVWTSPGFRTIKNPEREVDQHSVFHSVLNLLGVTSPIYDADKDIFQCATSLK
ncbi:MAG TPA: phosphoethanolamine--lipid A transferase EptA [Bacteroidales bacterium]|nr:phosphoethanolamine--lipid A transferase EptA [Bacteroidales bacterium]